VSSTTAGRSTSRRARLATAAAFVGVLVAIGGIWAIVLPSGGGGPLAAAAGVPAAEGFTQTQVTAGAELYAAGCATCHGSAGQGGTAGQAPSLVGVGAAAVDFQVSSGRMPLKQPGAEAPRHPVQYSEDEIQALDAYVASLGAGPAIPAVDPASGDIASGGSLFRANCANCHNFFGQGAPLSSGKYAPVITNQEITDTQIAEAIRTGPESMPVFSSSELTPHDINSIIRYIQFLRNPHDPGGNGLGHLGPVPEGLVIWLLGIGALAGVCLWIGGRVR
jgi:ubiquinol-cytochrome c reductase cytochrome c subunit